MAISEQSRHELYRRLEEALGPDAASTLMEHLPPQGWAEVATMRDLGNLAALTKRDLDILAASVRGDLETLEQRLRADFRSELMGAVTAQTRTIVLSVIGSNVTIGALAFAAAASLH